MAEPTLPIIDLDQIADPGARRAIQGLLNLVEQLVAENRTLREENRRLRDENLRLKGEPGRPVIKPNVRPPTPPDHSSERERHRPTPRQPRGKLAEIVIHRTEDLAVDRALLPPDAEFKGYEEVTHPGRCLPHRQCPLPQGALVLGGRAHELPGAPAAGLRWPVRARAGGLGAGALFRQPRQ